MFQAKSKRGGRWTICIHCTVVHTSVATAAIRLDGTDQSLQRTTAHLEKGASVLGLGTHKTLRRNTCLPGPLDITVLEIGSSLLTCKSPVDHLCEVGNRVIQQCRHLSYATHHHCKHINVQHQRDVKRGAHATKEGQAGCHG